MSACTLTVFPLFQLKIKSIITYQKTAQLPIEIYVQPVTQFITNNSSLLLPELDIVPKTTVIILLYSFIPLETSNRQVELEKQRLREEFLTLSKRIKLTFQKQGALITIIDPQDGKPINSPASKLSFDIIAVVHQLLNFSFYQIHGCKVLNHPIQQTAIYPGLLLSDVDITITKSSFQHL
ncbi:MAG: methylmalonic aciduria and homocystinuria type D protein [Crocosphaera sp.]